MDKEFILGYLQEEHLADFPKLQELCETSGIETVKQLLLEYEQEQFYIPKLATIRALMHDVVKQNKEMPEKYIKSKTGLSKKTIQSILCKIKKKSS